jgi:hypothetical protein
MNTPWGPSQEIEGIIDGIEFVSTAGHGGLKLDPAHNRRMPEYLRRRGGWYEEDCEWCLPAVVFEAELRARGKPPWVKLIEDGDHIETMKDWFPDEYERFFGAEIPPGESFKKDERQFYRDHAGDYIVVCAYGDWAEGVPAGFVGVIARYGGHAGPGPEKCFLVPEAEYDRRGAHGFVIDPARHAETPSVGPASKRVAQS